MRMKHRRTAMRDGAMFRIAIDGPGGAGKSTIAKQLAEQLGMTYIDTGAMYRAIGLKMHREQAFALPEAQLAAWLEKTRLDIAGQRILLDGEDVSDCIRTQAVSLYASDCSRLAPVRQRLVALQREIAAGKNVVMDGRDIGTNVLPDAELKIFLTAAPEIRARRRVDQLLAAGKEAEYEQIYRETMQRDEQDSHRALNPLVQAADAVLLDTSDMAIADVVAAVIALAGERGYSVPGREA